MKNKAKLINVKIPEYWFETADDYHEFKDRAYHYKNLGIKAEHEEVGYYGGCYNAVFWIGKKPIDFILENRIEE